MLTKEVLEELGAPLGVKVRLVRIENRSVYADRFGADGEPQRRRSKFGADVTFRVEEDGPPVMYSDERAIDLGVR